MTPYSIEPSNVFDENAILCLQEESQPVLHEKRNLIIWICLGLLPNHCNQKETASMTRKKCCGCSRVININLHQHDFLKLILISHRSNLLPYFSWAEFIVPIYFREFSALSFHGVICGTSTRAFQQILLHLCSAVQESSESGGHRPTSWQEVLRTRLLPFHPWQNTYRCTSLYICVIFYHFLLVSTLDIYSFPFQMFMSILMQIDQVLNPNLLSRVFT